MAKGHRNGLYALAAEYRQRHPTATATEAWRHIVSVAKTGGHEIVRGYDCVRDRVEYSSARGPEVTRTVARRTFFNQWYRLCASAGMK